MMDKILFSDYLTGETIGNRKSSFRIELGDSVRINGRSYTARSILYDAGDDDSWMDASISCRVHLEQN